MHVSVLNAWHTFSTPLEGRVPHMYLDILGLVTCGVGNLIDPVSEALKVTWYRDSDGASAGENEVRAAWNALKARPDLAKRHTSHARAVTGLHLRESDIDDLVMRRLRENEAYIKKTLPLFDSFPADAQLGILSMAWAVGAGFTKKFPTFTAAALKEDWMSARNACTIREDGNPGVVPRNRANRVCFANAALVKSHGMPLGVLHWPSVAEPRGEPSTPEEYGALRALAIAAAEEARFSREEERQRAAHREMSGLEEPKDEESTVVLDPRNA